MDGFSIKECIFAKNIKHYDANQAYFMGHAIRRKHTSVSPRNRKSE